MNTTGLNRCHGGDIYRNRIEYDYSVNLNPMGIPEGVQQALRNSIREWSVYPDPECEDLCGLLAEKHGWEAKHILCGNGAAELIYQLVRAIKPRRAVVPMPSFSEYEQALKAEGCTVIPAFRRPEESYACLMKRLEKVLTPDTDLVILCNPNNPDGGLYPDEMIGEIAEICKRNRIRLMIDECFLELTDAGEKTYAGHIADCGLIRIRAFTKTYAMAGIRLGYALIRDEWLMEKIRQSRQPWTVSVPAQIAGTAALKERDYLIQSRRLIGTERKRVADRLQKFGFQVYHSDANYLLFYTKTADLYDRLLEKGILIRDCSSYCGLGNGYYRICIRHPEENEILLKKIEAVLKA